MQSGFPQGIVPTSFSPMKAVLAEGSSRERKTARSRLPQRLGSKGLSPPRSREFTGFKLVGAESPPTSCLLRPSIRCQLSETLRLGVASLFQPVVIVNHSRLYISYLDKVLEIIRMQAEILNPQLL